MESTPSHKDLFPATIVTMICTVLVKNRVLQNWGESAELDSHDD